MGTAPCPWTGRCPHFYSMLKKIILFLIFFFYCVIVFLYSALNSPRFWEKLTLQFVRAQYTDIEVSEFKIGKSRFQLPLKLNFSNIKFSLTKEKEMYVINLKNAVLDLVNRRQIQIQLRGLGGRASSFTFNQADALLLISPSRKGSSINGDLKVAEMDLNSYQLRDIAAKIIGEPNQIRFKDIIANFYDGQMSGEILLDYHKQITYSIEAELTHVSLNRMRSVNPAVFSKIQGQVDGHLKATGDAKKIHSIQSSINAPSGGELKASLLSYLVRYIPPSQQRDDLEELVATDGDVSFEKANLQLESVNDKKLLNKIKLESNKFNLDINLDVEINIEGGLNNLLNYYSKKLSR